MKQTSILTEIVFNKRTPGTSIGKQSCQLILQVPGESAPATGYARSRSRRYNFRKEVKESPYS